MLGKCFGAMIFISFAFALMTGNMSALSGAILDGASKAVTLSISLCGIMCLWGGVMSALTAAGVTDAMSRLLRPVLRLAFPDAFRSGTAVGEITACVGANLLGLGNAATPLAVAAMKKMRETSLSSTATDDMVTLTVLGTSSFNLFPSTIIALRRAAGSADPYSVIVPIWITSALCCVFSVTLCRILASLSRLYRKQKR